MSDDPFSSALVSALLGTPDANSVAPNAQMRYGTVTQVSPLLVQVGAATTAMPCKAAGDYFPVLNDYVLVLVQGADRIVVASTSVDPSISRFLIDAKGDLIVGTADNTAGRLAVGANGTVLTADSTQTAGVAWVAPSRIGYSAAFSIVGSDDDCLTGVVKNLTMGVETVDTNAFATAGSSSGVTIPAGLGGLYSIAVSISMDSSALGTSPQMSITAPAGRAYTTPGTLASGSYALGLVLPLAAGDSISVSVFQNGGATRQISSSAIHVYKIGV